MAGFLAAVPLLSCRHYKSSHTGHGRRGEDVHMVRRTRSTARNRPEDAHAWCRSGLSSYFVAGGNLETRWPRLLNRLPTRQHPSLPPSPGVIPSEAGPSLPIALTKVIPAKSPAPCRQRFVGEARSAHAQVDDVRHPAEVVEPVWTSPVSLKPDTTRGYLFTRERAALNSGTLLSTRNAVKTTLENAGS